MDTKKYLKKYIRLQNNIQQKLLEYIDDELDEESNDIFFSYLDKQNIQSNKYGLKEVLHLLAKLSKNHHRSNDFFSRIELIILYYKEVIQNFFSNFDIFNIFKNSKRILLFLFEEKILIPENSILQALYSPKYQQRNYPEFFDFEHFLLDEDEEFKEKRKAGENDSYICQLIQKDQIEDFISYVNRWNISLKSKIPTSIFETNSIFLDKSPTLIEYAMFFGSIQIVRYLFQSGVCLESSHWIYAIHSRNPELIHFLEEKHEEFPKNKIDDVYKESIKCFHNEFANYFIENYDVKENKDITFHALKCHNYCNFKEKDINIIDNVDFNIFQKLIEFDYIFIVNYFLTYKKLDYNIFENQENAIKNENTKIIKIKASLFHVAVLKRKTEIVEILLANEKINPNIIYFKYKKLSGWHFYFSEKYNVLTTMNSLFLAVKDGNPTMLKILLSNPKIDTKNELIKEENGFLETKILERNTLFEAAIKKDNVDIVKIILSLPDIDVNYKFFNMEKTALHIAIEKRNFLLAKLLLSHKDIDVNIDLIDQKKSFKLITTLYMVVETENLELIEIILSKPNLIIKDESYKLIENSKQIIKNEYILAAEKENLEIMKILLTKPEINVNFTEIISNNGVKIEKNALFMAVEKNNSEMVSLLLSHPNIDIDINYIKSEYDISKKTNILCESKTPLFAAFEKENYSISRKLLEKQSCEKKPFSYILITETQKIKTNEFIVVVENGYIEMLMLLLQFPKIIDINIKKIEEKFISHPYQLLSKIEKNALSISVENENLEIIKLLLQSPNIDINIKTREYNNRLTVEKTPLYQAIEKENIEIINQLLQTQHIDGRDFSFKSSNIDNKLISNMLIKAVEKGNYEISYNLLKIKDIDINFKQIKVEHGKTIEQTALSIAIENDQIEIIKILLDNQNLDINQILTESYKIDESKCRKIEKTVLFNAINKGNIEILNLLLSHNNIDINKVCLLEYIESQINNEYKKIKKNTLKSKISFNKIIKKRTVFHSAISSKNIKVISILMQQKGISMSEKDEEGKSPFDYMQDESIKRLLN